MDDEGTAYAVPFYIAIETMASD
jgi:hypothetical protein